MNYSCESSNHTGSHIRVTGAVWNTMSGLGGRRIPGDSGWLSAYVSTLKCYTTRALHSACILVHAVESACCAAKAESSASERRCSKFRYTTGVCFTDIRERTPSIGGCRLPVNSLDLPSSNLEFTEKIHPSTPAACIPQSQRASTED